MNLVCVSEGGRRGVAEPNVSRREGSVCVSVVDCVKV